jgi:hypothetical protein
MLPERARHDAPSCAQVPSPPPAIAAQSVSMVDDVDAALAALLAAPKAKDQKLACAFDAPTPEWAAKVKSPMLNLFLVHINENLDARPGAWTDVRDETGQTIGRQPPLRRYDMHYLLSAWGGGPDVEHRLLGAVLTVVPSYDTIPAELLSGSLAERELPVRLRIGQDDLGVSVTDVWASLGQQVRASLTLVVTAPLLPTLITDLAAPAETLDIGLAGVRPRKGRVPAPDLAGVEPLDARVAPEEDPRQWTTYRVRERNED